MDGLRSGKEPRILLWIILAHEGAWLLYDALQLWMHRASSLGSVLFDLIVRAGLCYLIAGALASNRTAIAVLSWVLRILGILSMIGTVGIAASAVSATPVWQETEMGVFACLYVVVGFWLAKSHKEWRRSQRLSASTIPELDVQEPYVRYPRP